MKNYTFTPSEQRCFLGHLTEFLVNLYRLAGNLNCLLSSFKIPVRRRLFLDHFRFHTVVDLLVSVWIIDNGNGFRRGKNQ